jgi:hypothetical protein
MAHITIVPQQAVNDEELTYDGDVQLHIEEPNEDLVIVTVKDADGTDIIFENPKNYTFSEDE